MKKFKLPSIKFKKIRVGYALKYIFLILVSSLLFANILIALPLTERVSEFVAYDLTTKNDKYWSTEYTLVLDTENVQSKDRVINQIKTILFKRLSTYGVEKTTINNIQIEGKDIIKVDVQTSKPQMYVDELIRNPFIVKIVTQKDDVDFNSEEDPYAVYMGTNYNDTEFGKDSFRNIYITKLRNSANEYSYFALYKTWPWNTKWNEFLNEYKGQQVGVSIDGFVTPIQIPYEDNPTFALPISTTDKSEAGLISILYNSGNMPISYTQESAENILVEEIETDYVKITEGILVAVLVIYLYLLLIDKTPKKTLILSALSTIVTISTWITYLKLSFTPIDIFLLAVEVITMVAIIRVTTENKESRILVNILLALIASISIILGTGYVKLFGTDILMLIIIANISQIFSEYYINKIKEVFRI